MVVSRLVLACAAVVLGVAGVSRQAAGQIVVADLFFFAEYDQPAPGIVVGPSQFAVTAGVEAAVQGDLTRAELLRPAPLPPVVLSELGPVTFRSFEFFTTLAELEGLYPAGQYRVRVGGGKLGELEGELTRPAEPLFSDQVPEFTGDTHVRMQTVDPASDFVFTVTAFVPAAGANASGTFLIITPGGGGPEIFSAFISPEETEVVMPAGTLAINEAYTAALYHSSRVSTPGAGPGGSEALVGFDRVTRASLFTLTPCPGLGAGACSPADWNEDGIIDFNDLLAFLNGFTASDPCADLNLDGAVDFNDLLEFLNGYNAGC